MRDYAAFREQREIPESRFHVLEADGRKLPFPDAHFSRVYSISVLEHIPGEGDTECAREIARTMKRGAICVITVPFAPESGVEYKRAAEFYWSGKSGGEKEATHVFFQRRYSEQDLHERLVVPSGLRARKILVSRRQGRARERKGDRQLFSAPDRTVASPALPAFPCQPLGVVGSMKRPLGALLVLEKT